MHKLIVLVLTFPVLLFCEWDDLFQAGDDPQVAHHVNVVTGKLQLSFEDHVVKGAVPLPVVRTYASSIGEAKSPANWQLGRGWNLFPETHLFLDPREDEFKVHVKEPSGKLLTFSGRKGKVMKPKVSGGQIGGGISGRFNSNNHRLHLDYKKGEAILCLADGGKRIYKGAERGVKDWFADKGVFCTRGERYYLLQEEISPSGQRTLYRHEENGLRIFKMNPQGTKVYSALRLYQEDQKRIHLRTSDQRGLSYRVKGGKLASMQSDLRPQEKFEYQPFLTNIEMAGRENLHVEYYIPAEKDARHWPYEAYKVKAIFEAGVRVASFTYSEGITEMRDVDNILTRYYFTDNLDRIEYFDENDELYSSQQFTWEEGRLITRAMPGFFSKTFVYDDYGNVIKETLEGSESYSRWYEYDPVTHLLMKEVEQDGLTYHYTYLEGTDLVLTKSTALTCEEFVYDDDHLLIKEILRDDQFSFEKTYTRDSKTGMVIATHTGDKEIRYGYSGHKEVIREDFEDYSIHYKYHQGRLVSKTTPCGGENRYEYDLFGNLMMQKEVGSPEVRFTHDALFRPVSCTVNGKTTRNTYNAKGSILSETDPFGHVTWHTYDAFERRISTTTPEMHREYGYDPMGNQIFEKDGAGNVWERSYNTLHKLTGEIFPDGSEIRHIYNRNSTVRKTIYQDGSEMEYTYDPFQNMTSRKEEKWVYSPLRLLSYTDSRGLETAYSYDEQGRKIEERALDRITTHTYDSYGFDRSVTRGDVVHTTVCDAEGKVLSENENIVYVYDNEGRRVRVIKGEAVDFVEYDLDGRIVRYTDPLGAVTQFQYGARSRTTIDPVGNVLVETYDGLNRLIRTEREGLSSEEHFYDSAGHVFKKSSHVYRDGGWIRDVEVEWEHDFRGLVTEERALGKVTRMEYDFMGRPVAKVLPNGVVITSAYDDDGRLSRLSSSDGTVDYEYRYASGKEWIGDLERRFNLFGELIEERRGAIVTKIEYDTLGREKSFTLPDGSQIVYEYRGKHMVAVKRLSPEGKLLYQHTYDEFDQNGHVHKESLISSLGQVTTHHDLLERPNAIASPYHNITRTFTPTGLVETANDKHYEYDGLYQLIKEGDEEYHFDSLGNPPEVNEHSQLPGFIYDTNGNPIKKVDDGTEYQYDALGRLIKSQNASFVYDHFSRLVSNGKRYYIYDRDYEIGSVDENNNILDLKALGLGINGDIGAAVAIEIGGTVYAPIHDFQGNITALVDMNKNVVDTNTYDAFGRDGDFISPWRFCSKRYEEGLIYFGKRFYDPSHGRWLTPDPAGFIETFNVYLYVLNSPLNRLDLFGLESIDVHPRDIMNEFQHIPYVYQLRHTQICMDRLLSIPYAPQAAYVVISGSWHKIHYSPWEVAFNKANLFNHFQELFPKNPNIIGGITGQGGIGTTLDGFKINSESLMENIPEDVTYIGRYNHSFGIKADLSRYFQELSQRKMTYNAIQTGLFLGAMADGFRSIDSKSLWLYVLHSEAGLLFNLGYTILNDTQKETVKNQLYVFAVAPGEPVSWKHCFDAYNIYSNKDKVTGWCGRSYQDNPDYVINFISSKASWWSVNYIGEHSFTSRTYSGALGDQIGDLRIKYGFYDARKR